MDAGTMINYQVYYENTAGQNCDILYDVNKDYSYIDTSSGWPTLNEFDPDSQDVHSPEALSDPAINEFINLIFPDYVDNNHEFRNMTSHPSFVPVVDSESDTESVILSGDELIEFTSSRQDDYRDNISDSSVPSGHWDNYPSRHIPSPEFHAYNNQTLPSFEKLVQSTTINHPYPVTTMQCISDDDDEESEAIVKKGKRGAKNILLWKFLLDELADAHQKHIRWISCKEGTFRFVDTAEISKLWGSKKRKNDMNFEKLSRGIRHYYKSGFMRREDGTRLVYKFNWKKVPKEYRRRFAL